MGDGANGVGPVILFFLLIFVLAIYSVSGPDGETRSIFGNVGNNNTTSTENEPVSSSGRSSNTNTTISAPQSAPEPEPQLSPEEIERKLDRAYRKLDELQDDLKVAELWGDRSPFEDEVSLSKGNAASSNYEFEYVTLRANTGNDAPIDISGWLLESYVTEEGATIPLGTRVYRQGRVNETERILLEPGEKAFIITGESPLGVSFHENKCTGYLEAFQNFTPDLSRSCPRIDDIFEDEANKFLFYDNDCYKFVNRTSSCRVIDLDDLDDADISPACKQFIEREQTYQSCFDRHSIRPYFVQGEWYVYLGRTDQLWRKNREVIRLFDQNRETVDVLEYK